jgi:signal transduction histidine kinase/DNA-binding response OmpR family regulator
MGEEIKRMPNRVAASSERPPGKWKVLVVEDDPGLRRLMQRELEREGIPVESAASGGEALRASRNRRQILLLLDYSLPDMTAAALVRTLSKRRNPPPFMLVTGMAEEKAVAGMIQLGARSYLYKDDRFLAILPSSVRRVLADLMRESDLRAAQAAQQLELHSLEERIRQRTEELNAVEERLKTETVARRRIRRELDASERQKASIVDAMTEIVVQYNRNFQINWANPAAKKAFASASRSVSGKICHELWFGSKQPCENCPVIRTYKTGKAQDAEVKTPNGHIWTIRSSPYRDAAGRIQGVVEVASDITRYKQAEAEIHRLNRNLERRVRQRTQELELANKELESFAYSVSHDLRAPLRAISGFAQIIRRRYREALDEEGRRYFDNIVQAAEHMGLLIEDLLKYARLGRGAVELRTVSMKPLLESILERLSARIDEVGAKVTLAEDPPSLHGNHMILDQIFSNVLENALTYSSKSQPPRISIEWARDDEKAVFSIRDNGIGIDPAFHEKIFRVFQRLHSQDQYPGTGIGLALVEKGIRLHGGNVWVESKPGEGSAFFLAFPSSSKNKIRISQKEEA